MALREVWVVLGPGPFCILPWHRHELSRSGVAQATLPAHATLPTRATLPTCATLPACATLTCLCHPARPCHPALPCHSSLLSVSPCPPVPP